MSEIPEGFGRDREPPLPRKGDQMFIEGEDWYHNACLNYMSTDYQWDWYASGYKLAGDVLVGHAMEARHDQDILVFPIVFNYRQYLELRLKDLISGSGRLLDRDHSIRKGHDLLKLWRQVRPNLEAVWPEGREHHEAIEEQIAEFCNIDAASFAFRYPVDTKGIPTLPDLRRVNLRQLREVMAGIATVLDAEQQQTAARSGVVRDASEQGD